MTTNTNESIQPLVSPEAIERTKLDKQIIDDMSKRHIDQLRYFHQNPDAFDAFMSKLPPAR